MYMALGLVSTIVLLLSVFILFKKSSAGSRKLPPGKILVNYNYSCKIYVILYSAN